MVVAHTTVGQQIEVLQDLYNAEIDPALKKAFETKILQIQKSVIDAKTPEVKPGNPGSVPSFPPGSTPEAPRKFQEKTQEAPRPVSPPVSPETIKRAEEAGFKFSSNEKERVEEYAKQHPVPKRPEKFIVTLTDGTRTEYPVTKIGNVSWVQPSLTGGSMKRHMGCPWENFEKSIRDLYKDRIATIDRA